MISSHVFIATSLDGYIAKLDGGIDWLVSRGDPAEDHGYSDFIKDIDGIVMGRGTFEKVLSFEQWAYTLPVVVLSRSLRSVDLPSKLVGKVRIFDFSPNEAISFLENEGWNRAYIDGGKMIQSFLRAGLISDMVITTIPVLLGDGLRLFGQLNEELSLKHLTTKSFPSGLVQSTYAVLNG